MLSKDDILEKIEANNEKIKKFGVKKIGLFGSYVNGNAHNDSDIDIIVEFNEGEKTFDNYMDLKIFLEDLFDKEIDLVIIDSIKPDIKPYILESVKYATGI